MGKEPAKIYGLIGYPVKHSLSAAMHNAAFRNLKINAQYRLFEVRPEELEDFLEKEFFNGKITGLNITIPHKIKAREILEERYPLDVNENAPGMQRNLYYVKLSGAVNTARNLDGKIEYWNTDASGFLKSLEDLGFNLRDKKVLLIGCGGAGRAIIAGLSWKNLGVKKIYVNDINAQATDCAKGYFSGLAQYPHLEARLEFITQEDIAKVIQDCALLINATPIGMKKDDPSPIEGKLIHKNLLVYDLVYNPPQTKLLNIARENGARGSNGLGMLLCQGVDAFELWTKEAAPVRIMRKAIEEGVKRL